MPPRLRQGAQPLPAPTRRRGDRRPAGRGRWGQVVQAGKRQRAVGDLADGLFLVGGKHQAEVVHPGRVGSGAGRAAWGTAGWVWRPTTSGVAIPAVAPSGAVVPTVSELGAGRLSP